MTQPPIVPGGYQPPTEPATPAPTEQVSISPASASTTATRSSTPAPIVAVILLLVAAAVVAVLLALSSYGAGEDKMAFVCAVVLVCAVLGAIGTWRHWEMGRTLAVIVGIAAVLAGANIASVMFLFGSLGQLGLVLLAGGVALIGLVVVPQSSRDWFR